MMKKWKTKIMAEKYQRATGKISLSNKEKKKLYKWH